MTRTIIERRAELSEKNSFSPLPRSHPRDSIPPVASFRREGGRAGGTREGNLGAARLFNYANLQGCQPPPPSAPSRQNSPNGGKPGGKVVAREPLALSHPPPLILSFALPCGAICLFSSRRCNPSGTKCYPCPLTLISWTRYNREHNPEMARIISATGLIKACTHRERERERERASFSMADKDCPLPIRANPWRGAPLLLIRAPPPPAFLSPLVPDNRPTGNRNWRKEGHAARVAR